MPTYLLPVTHNSLSFASSLLHFTSSFAPTLSSQVKFLISSRSRDIVQSLRLHFPSLLISHEHETNPDWSDTRDLREAFGRCDGVILAANGCGDDVMNLPSNSMDEWLCCEQNIASLGLNNHRVIKLSWTEGFVTEHSASTIGRQNWRLEKELKRSFQDRPENLTIVRASTGMDAFLRGRLYDLICGRTLSMSVKTGRIAFIHPLDVAESLSALLIKDAPEELYKLTGPEALSFKEVADIFSLEIQDKVTYSYFPLWAVQPARWVRGVPGDAIEEELGIARALESGAQQEVEYGTLEKLLGHKPRTLREFIAEHADAWPRTDPN